ncbi:MAG: hypothetical protein GY749_38770 [Desulfobacteraceae bacterium]|nr:hypothetical protein [Desulfobacteraceae bacterium]
MAENVYIGICVTAHDNSLLNTSEFDSLTLDSGAVTDGADSYEEDDSYSEANSVTTGQTQNHNFFDDAEDWIKFTAESGKTYTLQSSVSGNADTVFYLYDSSLSEITNNDDGGTDLGSKITYTSTSDAVHYLKITSFGGKTGDSNEYTVSINFSIQQILCNDNLKPTGSGQHQWGSSYADWYNVTWGIVFEQTIQLEQVALKSFHTNTFSLSDASGGYIGLQTRDISNDGTIETNVRYSVWNTDESEGEQCSSFGGEGVGQTCTIKPLELLLGINYTVRVERLTTETDGSWWQGSVVNESSGEVHIIGKIKVPHTGNERLIRAGGNFSEYFGPKAIDCQSVPQSIVNWQAPQVTDEAENTVVSGFRSFSKANPSASCSDAGVEASGEIINVNGITLYKMTNGSIPMCWGVN